MNYKLKQPDFDKLQKKKKTNPYRTLTNFQKKLTLMKPKIPNEDKYMHETINVFLTP